jgi:branched-chain amino acid transport system permease protein
VVSTWAGRWPGWLVLTILLVLVAQQISDYHAYVTSLVLIAAVQAVSVNLCLGYVGLLSFAQLAFFGIGSYGAVVLVDKYDLPFPLAILISVVGTAVIAAIFGIVAIRYTAGLFFALVTFALSEIIRLIATTWYSITGGPVGLIVGFKPKIFGYDYSSSAHSMIVFGVVLGLVLAGVATMMRRPLGQRFLTIREDPFLAEAIGIPTLLYRVSIFAASAGLAALIGALAAPFTQVITPSMMNINALIPLIGMVVVGGKGTVLGPVLGSVIFTLPPLLLTGLGNWNGILLGVIVCATALYLPNGLLSRFRPERTFGASRMIVRRRQ